MSHTVAIVTTGGTIASRATSGKGYQPASGDPVLDGMLQAVAAPVVTIAFDNTLSQAARPQWMLKLAAAIDRAAADPSIGGVVVTHGTVALEETAFLVGLYLKTAKPVVFTGAMFPHGSERADGARNLADAIRVAQYADPWTWGPVVCFGGKVNSARWARKLYGNRADGFCAPGLEPIFTVADGSVSAPNYRYPPLAPLSASALEEKVDLVTISAGMRDAFLQALVATGPRGLVLEGFPGNGAITPEFAHLLGPLLERGTTVVLATRSIGDDVHPASGGASGSFTLSNMGVLMGHRLSGPKLRLLLMAFIGAGKSNAQIEAAIATLSEVPGQH